MSDRLAMSSYISHACYPYTLYIHLKAYIHVYTGYKQMVLEVFLKQEPMKATSDTCMCNSSAVITGTPPTHIRNTIGSLPTHMYMHFVHICVCAG